MKRIFYSVQFGDAEVQACFDAIKFLCDPTEKSPAHITVRGPYEKEFDVRELDGSIRNQWVAILGPGCFFGDNQNTVFLQCGFAGLRDVWQKPDYGLKPHITLFDGSSRKFAEKLLILLKSRRLFFKFRASDIEPLISYKGQYNFDLLINFDIEKISKIVGTKIPIRITNIKDDERLLYVDKILQSLSEFAHLSELQSEV